MRGSEPRWSVECTYRCGPLRALEPTSREVADASEALSGWYSEPHNRAQLGGSAMTADEVREWMHAQRALGGRMFLLTHEGLVVGDADFRRFAGGSAEFAILIGPRALQGQGLGRRFAGMLQAFAFAVLGLRRVYVAILAANRASRRMFERLGYRVDEDPSARAFAEAADEVTMSTGPGEWRHCSDGGPIRMSPR